MPTASNVRAEPHYWPAVPDRSWDSIREEFTLPTAADLEAHFEALGDAAAMRRAVRVVIGEGTFCPGFQLKDGLFHEPVLDLFQHAMTLKIPHNIFTAWMVTPLPGAAGSPRWISWRTCRRSKTPWLALQTGTVRAQSAAEGPGFAFGAMQNTPEYCGRFTTLLGGRVDG